MAENPTTPPPAQLIRLAGNDRAPFVYFDNAITFGVLNGGIQIELIANTIVPGAAEGTTNELVVTAHLRCSPAAASDLRNALDRALFMLAPAPEGKSN